jgi:hypothetical protein
VNERGPWGLALWLRELAGVTHDESGEPVGIPDSMPGAVFGCVWCMSVWTGALMVVLGLHFPLPMWVLAASGAAIVVETVVGRLRNG